MDAQRRILISVVVLIVLVFGLYFFTDWFSKVTGYFSGEDENTRLAQCLDGKNVEFYSSVYCPKCEKQREELGGAFKFITQIDCGKDMENCDNIREVPAWYINKTIVYGLQNRSELRELSGCAD